MKFKIEPMKISSEDGVELVYIIMRDNSERYIPSDVSMAQALRINIKEYRQKMDEINGSLMVSGSCCFDKKEKAERALEWIESLLLMREMIVI